MVILGFFIYDLSCLEHLLFPKSPFMIFWYVGHFSASVVLKFGFQTPMSLFSAHATSPSFSVSLFDCISLPALRDAASLPWAQAAHPSLGDLHWVSASLAFLLSGFSSSVIHTAHTLLNSALRYVTACLIFPLGSLIGILNSNVSNTELISSFQVCTFRSSSINGNSIRLLRPPQILESALACRRLSCLHSVDQQNLLALI